MTSTLGPAKYTISSLYKLSFTVRAQLESVPIPEPNNLLPLHDGTLIKGIILTMANGENDAFGKSYDFVSRYFAPWNGIPEDPVTGKIQSCIYDVNATVSLS